MKLFGPESGARLAYGSIGRTALEAILALTTGILLARFAWVAVAPGQGIELAQSPQLPALSDNAKTPNALALLTQTNPFQAVPAAADQIAVPTSLNLKIAGLRWSDGEAGQGSAVLILPDSSQKRVSVGDQIISGAVLETVAADRVFLRFNGQLQELRLNDPNKPLFGSSQPVSPASTPDGLQELPAPVRTGADAPPATTPALLMSDIDLKPELRNGALSGYRLAPRGQGHFEAAGLEQGDLVLRVNGNSIEGMGPEAIQSAVMSSETIALDVVRNGAIVRLRLSPESGLSQ
ncbi:type II secretion system protein N [Hyphomonas sp.]|uniref:type II secretion system protein N n=1 Tax=Hyphomonas sp. TaxID=87 RepID=UPI001BCE35EF|nr:type II secretion system protein N [Hyphomonas sp.]